MGTINDGINGPFRGKAGSVIGSNWRKVNYIKGLPRFKNKRAASTDQLLERKKFALLNRFFDPISTVLEIGFRQFTSRATGKNVAIRYNYDHAFQIDETHVTLDYPALQFSHGSLFTAGDEQAWVDGDTLHITWDPDMYGMGRSLDDTARMVLYEEIRGIFYSVGRPLRHEGATQFVNKVLTQRPLKLHLWLFFVDRAGKQVSKTVYIPIANPES
ncbi:DUF6266 family protein [Parapedobacter indicus]|uniref:Uncharacterized protein n=1 Tax=Parapedobacter indicus TaxID=1477437 RepID=A0A1I3KBB1_9SPHI|nr:DUF6266 family protein [Parapedobacter indicus]PPL01762.1 hypothetical protein CLV26_105140 [Parapedobacter indicus]SFI69485.1 hypothetical protein SAMN05444682_105140 [Parapedobacter indicus]